MTKLTTVQIDFLKKIGVPINKTFDATGLSKGYYSKVMKERSLEVAYGVTPCAKGNHTLRTRAGHCLQCNSANIRFQNRHTEAGFLYLAKSKSGKIVKFGQTQDIYQRMSSLNESGYGGFIDWEIVLFANVIESGKIEKQIHTEIWHHRAHFEYLKDGRMQEAYEIFKLPLKKAKELFQKYVAQ